MRIRSVILLSILAIFFSFTENSETRIDVNNLDEDKLELLILEKVNELRKNKRKPLLVKNSILGLAATNQANFLKKNKQLVHNQKSRKTRTPMDRTDFYGGKFRYVGENIAYTYLYERVKGAINKRNSTVLWSYEATADYFYQLWKNSKTHYKNLVDEDFNLSQIRFSYDSKTNRIYGVQVFGAF
jgi:uncharacterized protein YkwD|tara:strand:- start:23 stop:577 length:555 start_codon:yes stop_codon:yes gene_type:complete